MINVTDILLWCFQQNYHMDKSNADVHCAAVRFSPITFRLYEALMQVWNDEDITAELAEVRSHHGAYAEDSGR